MKLEYRNVGPLDCVFLAGYNDLVMGKSSVEFMQDIATFTRVVMDQPGSSVSVSGLMYPPQLAWLNNDGTPPDNYVNQRDKIDLINDQIKHLNIDHGVDYVPGFHSYGVRNYSKWVMGVKHKVETHRWEHWREREKRYKLHLTNERRAVMGTAVNNYINLRT